MGVGEGGGGGRGRDIELNKVTVNKFVNEVSCELVRNCRKVSKLECCSSSLVRAYTI